MTFKEAFASARKAGKKIFTWNGKRYTTELRKSAAPKKATKPKARPSSAAPKSAPKPKAKPTPAKRKTNSGRTNVRKFLHMTD